MIDIILLNTEEEMIDNFTGIDIMDEVIQKKTEIPITIIEKRKTPDTIKIDIMKVIDKLSVSPLTKKQTCSTTYTPVSSTPKIQKGVNFTNIFRAAFSI